MRIVAGQGELDPDGCTYFGIVLAAATSHPARTPIKRMRMSQSGLTRYVVSRMLEPHGVDLKTIETMRLPEAVMVVVARAGAIDAVAVDEPTLTRTGQGGKLWFPAQEAVPGFQWGVVTFGERLLTTDRETGMRFLRAYKRGVEQYREGKTPRNVAIISEATGETGGGHPRSMLADLPRRIRDQLGKHRAVPAWANAEGLMEHTVSRDQLWDSTFVTASAARPASSSQ